MVKIKYKILACGTSCMNSKGWDQKVIKLSNLSSREESKTYYNLINGGLFGQWNDNKVVSYILTLPLVGIGKTMRQCGSE